MNEETMMDDKTLSELEVERTLVEEEGDHPPAPTEQSATRLQS